MTERPWVPTISLSYSRPLLAVSFVVLLDHGRPRVNPFGRQQPDVWLPTATFELDGLTALQRPQRYRR
jgi:hypothetical protein